MANVTLSKKDYIDKTDNPIANISVGLLATIDSNHINFCSVDKLNLSLDIENNFFEVRILEKIIYTFQPGDSFSGSPITLAEDMYVNWIDYIAY